MKAKGKIASLSVVTALTEVPDGMKLFSRDLAAPNVIDSYIVRTFYTCLAHRWHDPCFYVLRKLTRSLLFPIL